MFVRVLAIGIIALFAASCDKDDEGTPNPSPIAYETVSASPYLQVDDPHTQVFRSWNRWSEFWGEHPECDNGCVVPAPYVNFDSSMVVAIFWGLEGFGCVDYTDRLDVVSRKDEDTFIALREQPMQEVCHRMTYAYLFLKIDRADGGVMFTGVVPQ